MKVTKSLEDLLKEFYRQYTRNEVVRQYGLGPWQLTGKSRFPLGDGGAQLAAVDRMIELGWVKILPDGRARRVRSSDSIQLTKEGIREAERLMRPWYLRHLRDFYIATVEAITRGLRRP